MHDEEAQRSREWGSVKLALDKLSGMVLMRLLYLNDKWL